MEKDQEIKRRILDVVEVHKGNQSDFARAINLKPSHLSMILSSSTTGLSAAVLKSFADYGVDMNWLLTGEGEIMRNRTPAKEYEKKISGLEQQVRDANNLINYLERFIRNDKS